jgi:hypothetical protein
MKSRSIALNLATLSIISALITIGFYLINLQLFSNNKYLSPTDTMFFEGIAFLIIGLLLLLGRGGINLSSRRAAILSALAGAVSGKNAVDPSEIFRRDNWKPQGFIRLGIILIFG